MLEKLQPASFKGIGFLVDSVSTDGGRKLVTHEYPNTGRRFVEDLGDLQETFSISGFVSGSDYNEKRDSLIAALKSSGRGELIHPMFGAITVIAKPYSLSENFTEFGIAKFSMTFEKCDESVFPNASTNNTSLINQLTGVLGLLIGGAISSVFNVTRQYPSNFLSIQSTLSGVSSAVGINANNVFKVLDEISTFSSYVSTFDKNINSNINNPSNLSIDFTNLFDSFSQIGRNATDQFELLAKLFGFGSDESIISGTTVQLVERESNRQIINSAVNISALSNAYNTVSQLSFTTEDDIKTTQNILDTQFNYIINNSTISDDIVQTLKNLRVEVMKFLEQEAVNAFKVATIITPEIPMTILCFQYYGSVDNTVSLLNLNNTIDSSFVNGDIRVLTL